MEGKFAKARRYRLAGSAVAGLAALVLAVSITLNENAVNSENRVTGDMGSYPARLGLLLLVLAAVLGIRAAAEPGRRGVAPPFVLAVIALGAAGLAFLGTGAEAILGEMQACLARSDAWLAVYTGPTPNPCGGYFIPRTEWGPFNAAAYSAVAAGVLCVVSGVLYFVGRRRWAWIPSAQPGAVI